MKKQIVAMMLGMTLVCGTLGGCGKTDTNSAVKIEENTVAKTIYGEVESIGDGTITIQVGTMSTPEKPDDSQKPNGSEKPDKSEDRQNAPSQSDGTDKQIPEQDQKMPGLDLTGETLEIAVNENIEIVKQNMGGRMQGSEMPNDEIPSGEKPDGKMPSEGQPDKELPSGQQPDKEMQNTEESITLSDISVGDIVMITYDESDAVTKITVMSMGGDLENKEPESTENVV